MEQMNRTNDIRERAKRLGFNSVQRLGLNPIRQEVGETLFLKIDSEIKTHVSKKIDPKTKELAKYDYVEVTNVETGESEMTFWLSGIVKHYLNSATPYVGKIFAITYNGLRETDEGEFNDYSMELISK